MPDPTLLARARALPGMARVAGLPGVHLVGGALRDLALGATPGDVDLAVEGELDPVLAALGGRQVRHDRFGTATAWGEGRRWDLSRTRAEIYPRPGALPEVRPAGIGEDLRRRDFTVNALALELATGRLRAAPHAEEDLAGRRLRVLRPASFADDPTRLLRLARYRARLGFAVEDETHALAARALAARALETVSRPRIAAELRLLAREPEPLGAWAALRELGIDEAIAPGFGLDDPELAAHALALLPADGRRDVLTLALAVRGTRDPGALLHLLGFPGEDARAAEAALAVPDLRGASPGEVAERLRTPEQAALAGALGAEGEARRWLEETRHVGLAVSGEDLRDAGVPPGPALGAALRELLRARRDGSVRPDRAEQLEAALRIVRRDA